MKSFTKLFLITNALLLTLGSHPMDHKGKGRAIEPQEEADDAIPGSAANHAQLLLKSEQYDVHT